MSALGQPISKRMIIMDVLNILPEKYRHFYSVWNSTSKDAKGLNNLITRLLIEEQRVEGIERESEALVARSSKPDNVKKCYNYRKIEHKLGLTGLEASPGAAPLDPL